MIFSSVWQYTWISASPLQLRQSAVGSSQRGVGWPDHRSAQVTVDRLTVNTCGHSSSSIDNTVKPYFTSSGSTKPWCYSGKPDPDATVGKFIVRTSPISITLHSAHFQLNCTLLHLTNLHCATFELIYNLIHLTKRTKQTCNSPFWGDIGIICDDD